MENFMQNSHLFIRECWSTEAEEVVQKFGLEKKFLSRLETHPDGTFENAIENRRLAKVKTEDTPNVSRRSLRSPKSEPKNLVPVEADNLTSQLSTPIADEKPANANDSAKRSVRKRASTPFKASIAYMEETEEPALKQKMSNNVQPLRSKPSLEIVSLGTLQYKKNKLELVKLPDITVVPASNDENKKPESVNKESSSSGVVDAGLKRNFGPLLSHRVSHFSIALAILKDSLPEFIVVPPIQR
ncbi:hypothetical protein DdX_10767 [Ditylenchus destructor]|uniref:Uncharacterized protein n=1 Tax=Ditylenchus destructor TaxID=166010 RepID=A0AAD4N297_9BILA|nr:hypothetical protein DdX_10767 [Ditylenchus destructor]